MNKRKIQEKREKDKQWSTKHRKLTIDNNKSKIQMGWSTRMVLKGKIILLH